MLYYFLIFNRQKRLRLQKWYECFEENKKQTMVSDLINQIYFRNADLCNFIEYDGLRIIYKRYASLYFCCAVDLADNELMWLDLIHRYVESLDRYFENVCELDIVFHYEKAYFILDEYILGGEVMDGNIADTLLSVYVQDQIQEKETKKSLFGNNRVG